jgi:para-nitrobenzyl esterase
LKNLERQIRNIGRKIGNLYTISSESKDELYNPIKLRKYPKMRKILTGLTFILSFGLQAQQTPINTDTSESPTVQTSAGTVRGVKEADADVFKGIPNAAAPVGQFRWRAPQPFPTWQGVKDASKFCADCAQGGWPRQAGKIRENTSEDCLFLNI